MTEDGHLSIEAPKMTKPSITSRSIPIEKNVANKESKKVTRILERLNQEAPNLYGGMEALEDRVSTGSTKSFEK
ncbi:hypothetical protein ANCCEY_00873 [Ancylostoma ceylanicum]|uniref:SHSP domain-containing protein n=1 Tax=Ancylostoma ceylanicum TaxID=53326 RepID=A0A0D6M7F1_9BILA|nr:hypothetical protein ANCCEY_00873 [Ancylostoma ceylanicum]